MLRAGTHADVGERPLQSLGEQGALRVEGLVAGDGRVADHRVDHHLGAVVQPARPVAAQDHRELLALDADSAQRPQVVHVQAGGLDVDGDRAVGYVGVGALPDDEGVQGGVGFRLGGVDGEHVPNLAGGGPG
jgi:hypothetical protein